MAYEITHHKDDELEYNLPRRIETFEEAWTLARMLCDLYIDTAKKSYTITFNVVD